MPIKDKKTITQSKPTHKSNLLKNKPSKKKKIVKAKISKKKTGARKTPPGNKV